MPLRGESKPTKNFPRQGEIPGTSGGLPTRGGEPVTGVDLQKRILQRHLRGLTGQLPIAQPEK